MSEQIKYGFGTEVVGGKDVDFVMTGDGYTQFHDVYYGDYVGLAIAYGEGNGELNKLTVFDNLKSIDDLNVGFIIKFTKPESIDALITQLNRVKYVLNNKHKINSDGDLELVIGDRISDEAKESA